MQTAEQTKPVEMTDEELIKAILDSAPPCHARVVLDPRTARVPVQFVASIVPRKHNLPILSTLKCVTNGSTKIISTDLDLTITAELPEKAIVEGACLIAKPQLMAAVKTAKQSIEIDATGLVAEIHTDSFKQKVNLLPVEEWPSFQEHKAIRTVRLSAAEFKRQLKRVDCAISTDESSYVLNGVYLEIHPETVKMIATDGRRLHATEMKRASKDAAWAKRVEELSVKLKVAQDNLHAIESNPATPSNSPELAKLQQIARNANDEYQNESAPHGVIVPVKTVEALLRLPIAKDSDTLFVVIGKSPVVKKENTTEGGIENVSFLHGQFLIESKLIDGNYPNYKQVIPTEFKETIAVDPVAMVAALKHAATACTEKSNSVKLTFTKDNLNIRGHSPDIGEAKADVEVKYNGGECCAAFNPRYLMETCEAFKSGPIVLNYTDELTPIVVTQGETLAVIMPMRLS